MRVGLGYDIHRIVRGHRLVLGGVEIPCEFGLDGHSDADVILHAVMDAMLGALALGDIGQHFPPTDERYRGISSLELLEEVAHFVHAAGQRVSNVDIVLVAEAPKIAPYSAAMRQRIADALNVQSGDIGLKATTNEGAGPEGRLEAMSAQAVVLLDSAS